MKHKSNLSMARGKQLHLFHWEDKELRDLMQYLVSLASAQQSLGETQGIQGYHSMITHHMDAGLNQLSLNSNTSRELDNSREELCNT